MMTFLYIKTDTSLATIISHKSVSVIFLPTTMLEGSKI